MLKQKLIAEAENTGAECAFVIRNLKTGDSWNYQESRKIKSASLIKVFVMSEAVRRVRNGTLALDSEINVDDDDIVPFSVLEFMKPRAYQLEELLRLMIVYSDNTATNVLIDELGMDRINDCIRDMGFENSVLLRKMMDFEAASAALSA